MKGNWLQKHIRLFAEDKLIVRQGINQRLEGFYHLITIRNCIVHAWGLIENANSPDKVRDAISRLEEVEEMKDGFLYLGDGLIPEAITMAEEIIYYILGTE